MNAKQIKHYEIMSEFFAGDTFDKANVDKRFGALLKLDYTFAEDLWEFLLVHYESELSDKNSAALLIDRIFELFLKASESRALKTVNDRVAIQHAVFTYSPSAHEGDLFDLPVSLLLTNKVDAVDAIFKNLFKNDAMGISFGEYMVKFLDKYFIEMMKKSSQHRVELNRKQSTLLMSYAQRVKGDEKAMLVQRIKEVL